MSTADRRPQAIAFLRAFCDAANTRPAALRRLVHQLTFAPPPDDAEAPPGVRRLVPGSPPAHWRRHGCGGGWVHRNAAVDPKAYVARDAVAAGGRIAAGGALCDRARIADGAEIGPGALVGEDAQLFGNARALGRCWIGGNAALVGWAVVAGQANVAGHATLTDQARVDDAACVSGHTALSGRVVIRGRAILLVGAYDAGVIDRTPAQVILPASDDDDLGHPDAVLQITRQADGLRIRGLGVRTAAEWRRFVDQPGATLGATTRRWIDAIDRAGLGDEPTGRPAADATGRSRRRLTAREPGGSAAR